VNGEDVHAFARLVAGELGWRYDVGASRNRDGELLPGALIKPGLTPYGVRIRVAWQRPTHFLCVGDVPSRDKTGDHRWTYTGSMPSISVRQDRGAHVVAREIKRRLLPQYEPAYAAARETLARCNADIDESVRVLAMLAPFGRASSSRDIRDRVYLLDGAGVATVTTTGVDLNVSVTAKQAVHILKYLTAERR
jgi:hypothetical protein